MTFSFLEVIYLYLILHSDILYFPPWLLSFDSNCSLGLMMICFFFIPFYTKLTCIISTAEIIALDVWAVTCQDDWVITSPNIKYVPQAHIFYDKDLHAQADSYFGLMDCFQWPQSYVKDYSHAVCIPWKDTLPTYTIAWYTPTHNNFVTAAGSLPSVGLLQEDSVQMLEQLFKLLCT